MITHLAKFLLFMPKFLFNHAMKPSLEIIIRLRYHTYRDLCMLHKFCYVSNKKVNIKIKEGFMAEPKRTQKERKEGTSARLIDETIRCLLEFGYAGTNVKEICKRAGVTTGAIQHNFNSKQGLMIAVVRNLFKGFDEGIERLGPSNATLDQRIDNFFEHYWHVYINDQYYAVCEVLLAVRRDPELLRLNQKIRSDWLEDMRNFLELEFPDVEIETTQKISVVLDMIDFMRGFCIRRIYGPSDETTEAVKERARLMIKNAFKHRSPI